MTSELAAAPIAITNSGSYTQNFDSLPTSGTSNVWSNDVTLAGWWAEQSSGGATAIIRAGSGSSNTGALYSFGTGTAAERALGSTSSGTPGTITFGVQLQNSTTSGQNLTLGDLQFTGEQWRNGGNTSSHIKNSANIMNITFSNSKFSCSPHLQIHQQASTDSKEFLSEAAVTAIAAA